MASAGLQRVDSVAREMGGDYDGPITMEQASHFVAGMKLANLDRPAVVRRPPGDLNSGVSIFRTSEALAQRTRPFSARKRRWPSGH